ncbi:alpha/beta superfamily hydrolase [Hypoxylon sp. FL1857]|nr:alpha/beta superfamily hydrolase [Hypoxylon sp. FL1857]
MSAETRENVEIQTYDQTTLRGWFYPAGSKSAALVMSPGLSATKGTLDHFARRFQAAGIAVLLYDHRNWGESDGNQRHHSSLYEQTQDTHDVIHYVSTRPEIDPARIGLWGSSYSGGVAIIAAAVDPRIKVVVSQVPFLSGKAQKARLPADLLEKIYADRGASTIANPTYIPVWPDTLEQAQQRPGDFILGTEESWHYREVIRQIDPENVNKITFQSMFDMVRAEPGAFISQISPRPLLTVIAKHDSVLDSQIQQEIFDDAAGEPKQLLKLDCAHFDVYTGYCFEEVISAEIAFLKQHL